MPRQHPTVEIPDIGPIDHAWDLLGCWRVTLTPTYAVVPVSGTLTLDSWEGGELEFDDGLATALGWPSQLRLSRDGDVTWSDAGGGAIAFTLRSADASGCWSVTAWPGELAVTISDDAVPDRHLATLAARRTAEYYRAKYPATAA